MFLQPDALGSPQRSWDADFLGRQTLADDDVAAPGKYDVNYSPRLKRSLKPVDMWVSRLFAGWAGPPK